MAVLLDLQTRATGLDLSTVFLALNIELLAQFSKALILIFYKIFIDNLRS